MNVIVEQAIYEMNLLANNVPDGKTCGYGRY